MSAVLLDDPVSFTGIKYNTRILILNENATKVNIPMKGCVQISFRSIVVHDVPYFETSAGTIRQLSTWVELMTNSVKYPFF